MPLSEASKKLLEDCHRECRLGALINFLVRDGYFIMEKAIGNWLSMFDGFIKPCNSMGDIFWFQPEHEDQDIDTAPVADLRGFGLFIGKIPEEQLSKVRLHGQDRNFGISHSSVLSEEVFGILDVEFIDAVTSLVHSIEGSRTDKADYWEEIILMRNMTRVLREKGREMTIVRFFVS